MKRFLIIFLCLLAASCQKELPARLEVAQSTLSAESAAGGQSLDIVSTHSWTVRTDVPWCKVIPSSGNGGVDAATSLYILFEENAYHYARNCTITLSSGGLTQTVTLTQNHRQGVLVPVAEYDLGPEATSLEVPLWKTTAYTAEVDAACKDWLQITQTRSMSEGALVVEVGENPSVAREGTILLKYDGQEEVVTIRQSCGFVKFSDPKFEKTCLETLDWDYDGRISVDEARRAEGLILYNVTSFQGLEHFVNIRTLHCSASCDEELDISPLASLELLDIDYVKKLVVGGNKKLQYLYVSEYGSEPFEVSNCPALVFLRLSQSDTPQVSIESCPALGELQLWELNRLKTLNLDWLKGLRTCEIISADLLERITIKDMPSLTDLSFQHNPALQDIQISGCPVLNSFDLQDNGLQHLDLSSVPELERLNCSNTPLKELDLSGSRQLKTLQLRSVGLESLDFSGAPSLEFFECYGSLVKELDFTGLQHLMSIQVEGSEVTSLIAKNNPELWWVACPNNKIEYLEIQDCEKLSMLHFGRNQVHTLTGWTNIGAITELYCDNNLLTTLDVSGMPELRDLFCEYNQLSSLDLRSNYHLSQVGTYYNPGLKDIYLRPGQEIYFLGYDETVTTLHYEE